MSLDGQLVGRTTAEFMETLEQVYEGDDTARVIEVITIAVIHTDRRPETEEWEGEEEAEDGYSFVHYRASELAWHRQLGLIEAARWAVRAKS